MAGGLEGKVALVTGGSRGIGAAIARRLAREGAAVALTYSSSPGPAAEVVKAIEAAGGQALAIKADSMDTAALQDAVDDTVTRFGGLDIVVNNAAVGVFAPIDDYSLADFDRTVAINMRAVFVLVQAALKHLKAGGRIITIGSCLADRVPFPNATVYSMTKAAVAGLVRGLARDLGPRGITVNNVQPGPVDTDMNPADGPMSEVMKSLMAMPRFGHVDEIAGLVAYLAGPESGFVNGVSLLIDGGFAA